MHYFMSLKDLKVEIENLNKIDPDTFGLLFRLNISVDFTYPVQEDGHTSEDRYRDLVNIIMNHLEFEADDQVYRKLKELDQV